jgi:hypothetical protein
MASSYAIFVGWGGGIVGRERQALQVFNETAEYFAGQQRSGQIEGFEAFLLTPHGGDLGGFFLVRGERAKLDQLKASQEFGRILTRAQIVVSNVGVVDATTGEELQRQFGGWLDVVSDLV